MKGRLPEDAGREMDGEGKGDRSMESENEGDDSEGAGIYKRWVSLARVRRLVNDTRSLVCTSLFLIPEIY